MAFTMASPQMESLIFVAGTAPESVREDVAAMLMQFFLCDLATTSRPKENTPGLKFLVDVPSEEGPSRSHYHLRYVWVPEYGSSIDEVREFVQYFLCHYVTPESTFRTTRGGEDGGTDCLGALRMGMGEDFGLYIRECIPPLVPSQLAYLCEYPKLSYISIAHAVMTHLSDISVAPQCIQQMLLRTFNSSAWAAVGGLQTACPITPLLRRQQRAGRTWTRHVSVLELFHGPTASYADFSFPLAPHFSGLHRVKGHKAVPPSTTATVYNNSSSSSNRRGAAATAAVVAAAAAEEQQQHVIILPTSGDSGGALASSFNAAATPHVRIVLLYPLQHVSFPQKLELLHADSSHVRVIGVKETYDWCEAAAKRLTHNMLLRERLSQLALPTTLTTSSSFNWGLLMPQVVYFFWAYRQLVSIAKGRRAASASASIVAAHVSASRSPLSNSISQQSAPFPLNRPSLTSVSASGNTNLSGSVSAYAQQQQPAIESVVPAGFVYGSPIDLVVPTANLSNITAGFLAKMMGLPIRRLVIATNENDSLVEFIQDGHYTVAARHTIATATPSLDRLVASNLERLLYLLTGGDAALVASLMYELETHKAFNLPPHVKAVLQSTFWAGKCTDVECRCAIRDVYDESRGSRLLGPHTALAVVVAEQYRQHVLSTEQSGGEDRKSIQSGESGEGATGRRRSVAKSVLEVPLVVLGTDHWSKHPNAVYRALRERSMTTKLDPYGDRMRAAAAAAAAGETTPLSFTSPSTTPTKNSLRPLSGSIQFKLREQTIHDEVVRLGMRFGEMARMAQADDYTFSPAHPSVLHLLEKSKDDIFQEQHLPRSPYGSPRTVERRMATGAGYTEKEEVGIIVREAEADFEGIEEEVWRFALLGVTEERKK